MIFSRIALFLACFHCTWPLIGGRFQNLNGRKVRFNGTGHQSINFDVKLPAFDDFLMCVWYKPEENFREHALFHVSDRNESLVLWKIKKKFGIPYATLEISGKFVMRRNVPSLKSGVWNHLCQLWRETGFWSLYFNGAVSAVGHHVGFIPNFNPSENATAAVGNGEPGWQAEFYDFHLVTLKSEDKLKTKSDGDQRNEGNARYPPKAIFKRQIHPQQQHYKWIVNPEWKNATKNGQFYRWTVAERNGEGGTLQSGKARESEKAEIIIENSSDSHEVETFGKGEKVSIILGGKKRHRRQTINRGPVYPIAKFMAFAKRVITFALMPIVNLFFGGSRPRNPNVELEGNFGNADVSAQPKGRGEKTFYIDDVRIYEEPRSGNKGGDENELKIKNTEINGGEGIFEHESGGDKINLNGSGINFTEEYFRGLKMYGNRARGWKEFDVNNASFDVNNVGFDINGRKLNDNNLDLNGKNSSFDVNNVDNPKLNDYPGVDVNTPKIEGNHPVFGFDDDKNITMDSRKVNLTVNFNDETASKSNFSTSNNESPDIVTYKLTPTLEIHFDEKPKPPKTLFPSDNAARKPFDLNGIPKEEIHLDSENPYETPFDSGEITAGGFNNFEHDYAALSEGFGPLNGTEGSNGEFEILKSEQEAFGTRKNLKTPPHRFKTSKIASTSTYTISSSSKRSAGCDLTEDPNDLAKKLWSCCHMGGLISWQHSGVDVNEGVVEKQKCPNS